MLPGFDLRARSDQGEAERQLHLLRGQVWPRRKALGTSKVLWVAVVLGIFITALCPFVPVGSAPINEVAGIGLTYASISAGVCITALTFALALPGEERIANWAKVDGADAEGVSALGDLVFSLFWAALMQIVVVLYCVGAVICGYSYPLWSAGVHWTHIAGLGFGLAIFFYAVLELAVVLQTLVQVAVIFVFEERSKAATVPNTNLPTATEGGSSGPDASEGQ